ncbi:VCBS domain-containing protein, partial [Sinobacterium norvegicum]|uniref:VCBS domain-containing protein n=1 Tax=Sinobacterium norvegicum TaxID=1641715 RepID=UPI001F2733BC
MDKPTENNGLNFDTDSEVGVNRIAQATPTQPSSPLGDDISLPTGEQLLPASTTDTPNDEQTVSDDELITDDAPILEEDIEDEDEGNEPDLVNKRSNFQDRFLDSEMDYRDAYAGFDTIGLNDGREDPDQRNLTPPKEKVDPDSGITTEDGVLQTAGNISTAQAVLWSIANNGAGTFGQLNIDNNGNWQFDLANNQLNVQQLAPGETLTEDFAIQFTDGFGRDIETTITITVEGTNDIPRLVGDSSGNIVVDSIDSTGGTLSIIDIDANDNHQYSTTAQPSEFGQFSVNQNGEWQYNLNKDIPEKQLSQGQVITEQYPVTITDSYGGTSTEIITITITGTNDAPVIEASSDITGSVTEDTAVDSGNQLTSTGTMVSSDLDQLTGGKADHRWSVVDGNDDNIGSLTIDPLTGQWSYSIDNSTDKLQQLGVGETFQESFVVQVDDGLNNGKATETITLTIVGTNDVPVIEDSSDTLRNVTEDDDALLLTTGGQMVASDIDADDSLGGEDDHRWSVAATPGNLGSFGIDAISGAWTYEIDNTLTEVQQLGLGDTFTESFTVTVNDGQGGIVDQIITVTITGTNDTPVIEATSDILGDVTEDDDALLLTTGGQMVASDIDADSGPGGEDDHRWSVAATPSNLGSLAIDAISGAWTYEIDNTLTEVQQLGLGDTFTESFTVTVNDGQGGIVDQIITVTITGTNDTPVIEATSDILGDVTE